VSQIVETKPTLVSRGLGAVAAVQAYFPGMLVSLIIAVAATFLSGAAGALTEKQQTVFGPINSPTLNNAPFAGAQAVLQTYAQQIQDSIQKNGFYVRVPSGKQFYLYVLQTIDHADATFGGTGLSEENQPSATTQP